MPFIFGSVLMLIAVLLVLALLFSMLLLSNDSVHPIGFKVIILLLLIFRLSRFVGLVSLGEGFCSFLLDLFLFFGVFVNLKFVISSRSG